MACLENLGLLAVKAKSEAKVPLATRDLTGLEDNVDRPVTRDLLDHGERLATVDPLGHQDDLDLLDQQLFHQPLLKAQPSAASTVVLLMKMKEKELTYRPLITF